MRLIFKIFLTGILFSFSWAQVPYSPIHQSSVDPANPTAAFDDFARKQNLMIMEQHEAMEKKRIAMLKGQQRQGLIMMVGGICSSLFKPKKLKDIKSLAEDIDESAYEIREEKGHMFEGSWVPNEASKVGTAASHVLSAGCDNFMNKEGELGPWGDYTLAQIRNHPDQFGENIPSDITKWCPTYPSMTVPQREMFWVWTMMSMASSESTCDPNATAQGSHGTALGLFQVWNTMKTSNNPDSCKYASDLLQVNQNIRCAVDQLALELKLERPSLMSNEAGPYWGVLRTDDWNSARGADVEAAKKTRAILKQYPFCTSSN